VKRFQCRRDEDRRKPSTHRCTHIVSISLHTAGDIICQLGTFVTSNRQPAFGEGRAKKETAEKIIREKCEEKVKRKVEVITVVRKKAQGTNIIQSV
jgi:hypothetical protein